MAFNIKIESGLFATSLTFLTGIDCQPFQINAFFPSVSRPPLNKACWAQVRINKRQSPARALTRSRPNDCWIRQEGIRSLRCSHFISDNQPVRPQATSSSEPEENSAPPSKEQTESWIVRVVVDALTEGLRILGVGGSADVLSREVLDASASSIISAAALTDVNTLDAIRADYEDRAYFLTGNITDRIYDENCYFGDPTVKFTGREKWKRNLKLLVPFLEEPSIDLKDIQEVADGEASLIITRWRLRTYLRFPWRPLIDVNGGTTHTLDPSRTKVVSHVESWEVSGVEAISQMFIPSERAVWRRPPES